MENEQPDSFIDGIFALTNFSANDVVTESYSVERGKKGVVEDVNINFTTAGGQVYLAKRLSSGTLRRITSNISSPGATGAARFKINEGETLAIVLAATGAGVIEVVIDGHTKEKSLIVAPIQTTRTDFGI